LISFERRSEFEGDIDFLNTLKDDLSVLENSWKRGKLNPGKAAKHFAEIIDSLVEVARSEDVKPFETICTRMRTFLTSVRSGGANLDGACWTMTQQLIGLLKDTISGKPVENGPLQEWQSRWDATMSSPSPGERRHMNEYDRNTSGVVEAEDNARVLFREGKEMVENTHIDPKELLKKAQEALTTGNGENARVLALKAIELIAKMESEESKKKERQLRTDLETAVHIEAEAEETLNHIKQEMDDREHELASLTDRLTQARSSLEEKQNACRQIKKQIEEIETELASLKQNHKELVDQMHEALPARDAAERECGKLTAELERIRPELETLTDSAHAAEAQLARARQKKEAVDAEIEAMLQRIPA